MEVSLLHIAFHVSRQYSGMPASTRWNAALDEEIEAIVVSYKIHAVFLSGSSTDFHLK